ncbi:hypothetical protein DSO57_1019750 [Entomophthora muscae]|uniref:Uncharacterized protein n=2 Tax=Entomophthora muscae TaxID=34485 RepID=A0ACC2STC2_9FUNG|nr:hypothetical protein DSO57_1019750 [Entomophthora muscae]
MPATLRKWKGLLLSFVAAVTILSAANFYRSDNEHQDILVETKPQTIPAIPQHVHNTTKHSLHTTAKLNGHFFSHPPRSMQLKRAGRVKDAFRHAWKAYRKHAWAKDTINPKSKTSNNNWFGWGITMIDSLDTLLLMGLEKEYSEALAQVKRIDFTHSKKPVMVFETTIRYLGGLLGAYDLSPDPILLRQATTLADKLMFAFNPKSGFPAYTIDFDSKETLPYPWGAFNSVILAEIGSFQLEFHRLSQLTGNWSYADAAQKVIDHLDSLSLETPGLYPLYYDIDSGTPSQTTVSFGALGDSFYEYLLKRYLLTNKTEEQYHRMYIQSITALQSNLIHKLNGPNKLTMLGERNSDGSPKRHMDHLACFVPGMLALSAVTLDRPVDFEYSQELLFTCNFLYAASPTKLSPDRMTWRRSPSYGNENAFSKDGIEIQSAVFPLRPETVESIFYAYRTTGNPIYRDWGWAIFKAIEKHCKVKGGYGQLRNIMQSTVSAKNVEDSMESFFLAETLKYLYLLFMPPNHLDLQEYVLTTEAHPLKISKVSRSKQ